jgi:hypothetical protein
MSVSRNNAVSYRSSVFKVRLERSPSRALPASSPAIASSLPRSPGNGRMRNPCVQPRQTKQNRPASTDRYHRSSRSEAVYRLFPAMAGSPAFRPHSGPAAFTPGVGGAEEARTPDPLLAKEVLSQLSYGPSGVEPSMPRPFGRAKWLSWRAKMVGGPFWTRTRDLSLIRTAL